MDLLRKIMVLYQKYSIIPISTKLTMLKLCNDAEINATMVCFVRYICQKILVSRVDES